MSTPTRKKNIDDAKSPSPNASFSSRNLSICPHFQNINQTAHFTTAMRDLMQYHADGYNAAAGAAWAAQMGADTSSPFQMNMQSVFDARVSTCELLHVHASHVIAGSNHQHMMCPNHLKSLSYRSNSVTEIEDDGNDENSGELEHIHQQPLSMTKVTQQRHRSNVKSDFIQTSTTREKRLSKRMENVAQNTNNRAQYAKKNDNTKKQKRGSFPSSSFAHLSIDAESGYCNEMRNCGMLCEPSTGRWGVPKTSHLRHSPTHNHKQSQEKAILKDHNRYQYAPLSQNAPPQPLNISKPPNSSSKKHKNPSVSSNERCTLNDNSNNFNKANKRSNSRKIHDHISSVVSMSSDKRETRKSGNEAGPACIFGGNTNKKVRSNNKKSKSPSFINNASSNFTTGLQAGQGKIFHPIGKTGVSALHELCDKEHWEAPRFNVTSSSSTPCEVDSGIEAENQTFSANDSTSSSVTMITGTMQKMHSHEFNIAVIVNSIELGRGRGGTKKSAQQDAARRALVSLYPDVVFDANGILLDLGNGLGVSAVKNRGVGNNKNRYEFGNVEAGPSTKEKSVNCYASTMLEDLVPNLASRLAINGHQDSATIPAKRMVNISKYDSPFSNEGCSTGSTVIDVTSSSKVAAKSKSTTINCTGCVPGRIKQNQHQTSSMSQLPRIYPCTSTTSGISSTSEDGDDNAYYASRGASVCSALLHAMAQIDERIKNPPTFAFDTCANPATIVTRSIVSKKYFHQRGGKGTPNNSAKRKGGGLGGAGGAIGSKRQSAMNDVGRSVTIHRSSFACTASLVLHIPTSNADENMKMRSCVVKETETNNQIDEMTKDCTLGNNNKLCNVATKVCNSDIKIVHEKMRKKNGDGKRHLVQQLAAVGTGATKRESKHVASAKLLALLFPECSGMVEVIAAAESAREQYAAYKARSKQSKRAQSIPSLLSEHHDNKKGRRSISMKLMKENTSFAYHRTEDPPLPKGITERLQLLADGKISMGECSFSDRGTTSVLTPNSTLLYASRQKQIEDSVDSALQALHESDDEGRLLGGHVDINDVGRIVLRRVSLDDRASIMKLLRKRNGYSKNTTDSQVGLDGPLSLIGLAGMIEFGNCINDLGYDISLVSSVLWGGVSVTLLLTRAVASVDEPPLGCAVLTLGLTLSYGRVLRLSQIFHEKHLPRERFIECLEAFSVQMNCKFYEKKAEMTLSDRANINNGTMTRIINSYLDIHKDLKSGNGSLNFLQSVKEEECEDEADENDNVGTQVVRTHHKPCKRSRVV